MTSAMSSGAATRPSGHERRARGGHLLVGVDRRGHARLHHAGRHRVDADAVGPELLGEHLREHDDRGLAGPVGPRLAWAFEPDIDATATIAPRDAFSAGYAALARSHVARVLTANIASQSATA